ncbi:MAG: hypothetical protein P1P77_18135, partial [Spirochaetaceae bacterium]|nr:hypothetical protein [Spirochaetaceae bacterium]
MASESQNHPAAAVIHFQNPRDVDFTNWPIKIGSTGRFTGRSLIFEGSPDISIDFSLAKKNSPERMPQFNSTNPDVLSRIELAESILQAMQSNRKTGLHYSILWDRNAAETTFAGRIGAAARELSAALSETRSSRGSREGVGKAIGKLIGLGE